MWIWQGSNWPNFIYQEKEVLAQVEACVRAVAPLNQLAKVLTEEQRLDWEAAVLLDETLASAKIEGELYDRDSVRSSIVTKLGIDTEAPKVKSHQHSDAFVELLLNAIRSADQPLDHQTVLGWHQILFPVSPLLGNMRIGQYRDDVMQILSGRYGKQTVHYQAPGETSQEVQSEMEVFLHWVNAWNKTGKLIER